MDMLQLFHQLKYYNLKLFLNFSYSFLLVNNSLFRLLPNSKCKSYFFLKINPFEINCRFVVDSFPLSLLLFNSIIVFIPLFSRLYANNPKANNPLSLFSSFNASLIVIILLLLFLVLKDQEKVHHSQQEKLH